MKPKSAYIISLAILFFTGCEGAKTMTGTVISEKTGKPIAGAEILVKNPRNDLMKTDTSGNFLINSGFTSIMFGGPMFIFEVKKEEFLPLLIKKRNGHITILLSEKK